MISEQQDDIGEHNDNAVLLVCVLGKILQAGHLLGTGSTFHTVLTNVPVLILNTRLYDDFNICNSHQMDLKV